MFGVIKPQGSGHWEVMRGSFSLFALALVVACGSPAPVVEAPDTGVGLGSDGGSDGGASADTGSSADSGVMAQDAAEDAGTTDAVAPDQGAADSGETQDGGGIDAESSPDAGASPDAELTPDAASPDATAPPDAATPDAGGFTIAAHPPLPQIPNLGGPRLTQPELVLITYANDPNAAALEANARWLVTSRWLTAVGAEYGISPGTILGTVRSSSRAPTLIRDTEIQAMLLAGVQNHTLPTPANGDFSNTLYVVYYPVSTTVVLDQGGASDRSCQDFGGYHFEAEGGGHHFAYAVIPNCPDFFPGLTDLEGEEVAFSHEVIEAATDAFPLTAPAYSADPSGDSPLLIVGSEVADLCSQSLQVYREAGFVAQLSYSNAAAAAGDRDPCVPVEPPPPYFLAMASPDALQGVSPGRSVQLTVHAWSTVALPDWSVQAIPRGTFNLGVSLSRSLMNNGQTATLTLSVPPGTAPGNYAVVYLVSALGMTDYHLAYAGVVVQ